MKTIRMATLAALLSAVTATAHAGAEKRFCQVIEENRRAIISAARVENEAARKAALDRSAADAVGNLRAVGGDGRFMGWRGRVKRVSKHSDGSIRLLLDIGCDTTLVTERGAIQSGAPLFDTAARLKPGQYVELDGTLYANTTGWRPFVELSVDDNGFWTEPEFLAHFWAIQTQ